MPPKTETPEAPSETTQASPNAVQCRVCGFRHQADRPCPQCGYEEPKNDR